MQENRFLKGTVVQLDPETVENKAFAGCFMVITDPKPWGAQGYIQTIGSRDQPGMQASYRATFEEMEYVGQSVWRSD